MKGNFSAAQTAATFWAIRLTNFSDSMTHGPRMKAGVFPPRATGPIVRGLGFTFLRMIGLGGTWQPLPCFRRDRFEQLRIGRDFINRGGFDRADRVTAGVLFGIQFDDLADPMA